MKTAYELPRSLALGAVYGRRDESGVYHLLVFGGQHGRTLCENDIGDQRLVFRADDSVQEHGTCLWCVASWRT